MKFTINDIFPAPLIDDQIEQLKGKKYFTALDLKNGFHHIKINKKLPFTSFVTHLDQFKYLRMPFGLTNALRVFASFT